MTKDEAIDILIGELTDIYDEVSPDWPMPKKIKQAIEILRPERKVIPEVDTEQDLFDGIDF